MKSERLIPGKLAMNLMPKGLGFDFEPLNVGWYYTSAKKEKPDFILVNLGAVLGLVRDAYFGHQLDNTSDRPFKEHMKAWFFTVGYHIIDIVVPAFRATGMSAVALGILDEYKKSNPFFHDDQREINIFRSVFSDTYQNLSCDEARKVETKMVEALKAAKNHKGDNSYEMYQGFLETLERYYESNYRFVNFFRELAKRVARKVTDANKLYDPNREEFSAKVLRRLVRTLNEQGLYSEAREIKGMPENKHIFETDKKGSSLSPKSVLRQVA